MDLHFCTSNAQGGGRRRGRTLQSLQYGYIDTAPTAPYQCYAIINSGPDCPSNGPFAAVECSGKGMGTGMGTRSWLKVPRRQWAGALPAWAPPRAGRPPGQKATEGVRGTPKGVGIGYRVLAKGAPGRLQEVG